MSSTESDWIKSLPKKFLDFQRGRRLEEVECIIPDLVGMSRGRAMPVYKFNPETTFFLPVSLFYQTISGEYVDMEIENQWTEHDLVLRPDMSTASAVPWTDDATLQVIGDLEMSDGSPFSVAPRNVLKRIIKLYEKKNWQPIVAPEIEFYLTQPNTDPRESIEPSIGRTGRQSVRQQAYSMVAVDEMGAVVDTIYDYADAQGLKIDTLIQEGGAGQLEINLTHGDPLELADQVFYFKRTIREAALKHGVFATFMAKPMRDQPGSAMHIHQSVINSKTGKNIFTDREEKATDSFHHFIGGSQKHLMELVPFLAPYVNSYRRFAAAESAPTTLEWARDNRTTGIRIPNSEPDARRVENRVTGADTNPYLSIAASLAAGYLGLINKIKPRRPVSREVRHSTNDLPAGLSSALDLLDGSNEIQDILGRDFCQLYINIKRAELEEYQREISPWERQHLLLNT
jgi:glutamine synthetase